MQEILLRFIAGGTAVVLISALGRLKYELISGLFVLFPAVTLVSFYFLGQSAGSETVGKVALFSIYAVPTPIAFLLAFYFLQQRLPVTWALFWGVLAWLVAALVLVVLNTKFFHIT